MALAPFNIKERIERQEEYFAYIRKDLESKMFLPKRFELKILTFDLPLFHIKDTVTNKNYSNIDCDNDFRHFTIEELQELILEDLKWERRKERIEKLLNSHDMPNKTISD